MTRTKFHFVMFDCFLSSFNVYIFSLTFQCLAMSRYVFYLVLGILLYFFIFQSFLFWNGTTKLIGKPKCSTTGKIGMGTEMELTTMFGAHLNGLDS